MDRRGYIGGSDAAAVLGISPWRSPLDLYLEKTGEPQDDSGNAKAKRRGQRLEPYICDMLAEEHGMVLTARNKRYADPEHPFLACEVDAETADGENVEIKTVHPFRARDWGEELTDSIPVHYTAQAMHGLMVTGRDVCRFAVLIGDDLRLYRVERDAETIAALRERELQFWHQHIMPRIPPLPRTAADALTMFARDTGATVEATPAVTAAVDRLKQVKAGIKALEAEEESLADIIKPFIGSAAALSAAGKIIATWKAQSASRLDLRAIEAAHPDIVAAFKRTTETRVLRLK